jgi:hypothetical protein
MKRMGNCGVYHSLSLANQYERIFFFCFLKQEQKRAEV